MQKTKHDKRIEEFFKCPDVTGFVFITTIIVRLKIKITPKTIPKTAPKISHILILGDRPKDNVIDSVIFLWILSLREKFIDFRAVNWTGFSGL